jgi:serine/threonine-protein kinase HipA
MLSVYLHDRPVGSIEKRGAGIRFTYAEAAVEDPATPALSISLPKRPEPYSDRYASPYFRNLLPEQAYRGLVAAAAGTTPGDTAALLGVVGAECPGAVSIWPDGKTPPIVHEYQPLSDANLGALFTASGRLRLGNAIARGRLSLPGVQEKIALLRQPDGSWNLPTNGAVTSHILKQATGDFPELLENELFCMTLAENVGLRVPTTGLPSASVRVFCAERFDRTTLGSSAGVPRQKIHQEDFCQILRVLPERKYQREGGPGITACAAVIRQFSALPAEDLPNLVRWIALNALIGNEDAHAKNLAFLHTQGGLRLSPYYDLVSTVVFEHLERSLAMKIGGSWDVRNIQKSDWRRLAKHVDLPWNFVRVLLLELSELVVSRASEALRLCTANYGRAEVYSRISEAVVRHAAQMDRELRTR